MSSNVHSQFTAVVGCDFSDFSDKAIDAALEIAGLRGGEVHVVYVHQDLPLEAAFTDAAAQKMTMDSALAQLRERAEQRVRAVAPREGIAPKRVVVHCRLGSPPEEIAQLAADLDADLVVVGSHGRRGLSRVLLGSVAERVGHLARCPVWLIRPKAHVGGLKVPEIEPPCPECVKTRLASNGTKLWCDRHSEHHVHVHHFAYVAEHTISPDTAAYESTPEA